MSYTATIDKLVEAGLHPGKTAVKTGKETGKDLVGVFPLHTPEEIVYAAGCVPVGMWGGRTEIKLADKYLQSFCCSIMRTNVEYAMNGTYNMLKAVIIPTFCDTMKCIVENWKLALPTIPMVAVGYPQQRRLKAGIDYAVSEFRRVRHELEVALKTVITNEALEDAFEVYEDYRRTMREFTEVAAQHPEIITCKKRHLIIKAGEFMDKAVYTADVKEIIKGLKAEGESSFKGTKVVVTGLLSEPVEVLEIMDENNIAIVADDLSMGSRKWRTPARDDVDDVFLRMAYMIYDAEGDTFFYDPDKKKGQMIIDKVKELGADAIIVMMMKFCDPEEYDYPIIKAEFEEAGIPELYFEIDQQLDSFEQLRTRIQSFTEMLI